MIDFDTPEPEYVDFSCDSCGAEPGDPCVKGWLGREMDGFHSYRLDRCRAARARWEAAQGQIWARWA